MARSRFALAGRHQSHTAGAFPSGRQGRPRAGPLRGTLWGLPSLVLSAGIRHSARSEVALYGKHMPVRGRSAGAERTSIPRVCPVLAWVTYSLSCSFSKGGRALPAGIPSVWLPRGSLAASLMLRTPATQRQNQRRRHPGCSLSLVIDETAPAHQKLFSASRPRHQLSHPSGLYSSASGFASQLRIIGQSPADQSGAVDSHLAGGTVPIWLPVL